MNDSVRATQYVASYEHVSVLSSKEPYWDGWLLLIPNEITEKIEDIPDTVLLEMFSVVHALHELFVRKDEYYEGFMFFGNRGLGAGQQVPHAHFHFVPRFTNRVGSPFQRQSETLSPEALARHVNVYRSLLPSSIRTDGVEKPLGISVQLGEDVEPFMQHGALEVLKHKNANSNYAIHRSGREQDLLLETPPQQLLGMHACLQEIAKRLENDKAYVGYNLTAELNIRTRKSFPIRIIGRFAHEEISPLRTLPTLFA